MCRKLSGTSFFLIRATRKNRTPMENYSPTDGNHSLLVSPFFPTLDKQHTKGIENSKPDGLPHIKHHGFRLSEQPIAQKDDEKKENGIKKCGKQKRKNGTHHRKIFLGVDKTETACLIFRKHQSSPMVNCRKSYIEPL